MTQILTQNRKKRYGKDAAKEKAALKFPHQRAPNGRKITAKMPFPILLSSRSGVRVPSGVPISYRVSPDSNNQMQRGRALPARAGPSRSLMLRVPSGVPFSIQQNRIWWIWPSWLRRQIVALKIVGSSPIIHPIKFRFREEIGTFSLYSFSKVQAINLLISVI